MSVFSIIILIIIPLLSLSDQVYEEWVREYDGPEHSDASLEGMALDSEGNIYVTGHFYPHMGRRSYCTIKYDTFGNVIWSSIYDYAHGYDEAYDIEVSNDNYIYVTGSSDDYNSGGPYLHSDYCTIKYNTNGEIIWVSRYNSPYGLDDRALDLEIDNEGNIVITGDTNGSTINNYDSTTVKYDSNGNEIWVRRYNSRDKDDDLSWYLAIDKNNNVYVSGYTHHLQDEGSPNEIDIFTIKYSPDGDERWVKVYNGDSGQNDQPNDITVDDNCNVYVTGICNLDFDLDKSNFLIIKYDTDGNMLWQAKYGGLGYGRDQSYAIQVDSDGNVYVTGIVYDLVDNPKFCTIKYDKNGNELWIAKDVPGCGKNLIIDDNYIYVTGSYCIEEAYNERLCTIKYDLDGNKIWMITTDNEVENSLGECADYIKVDSKNNVFISGSPWKSQTLQNEYATVKYKQIGLDIELTSFNANPTNDSILLKWTICGEDDDFYGFNLYRKRLNQIENTEINSGQNQRIISWEKINSSPIQGENPFCFKDNNTYKGTIYEYKLEAVYNKDYGQLYKTLGTTEATAGSNPNNFSIVAIYPNPSSDIINCILSVPQAGTINISIYDISGRKLIEKKVNIESPNDINIPLNVSEFSSGVYNLTAEYNTTRLSKIIVIE